MLIDTQTPLHVVAGTPVVITMSFRVPATPTGTLTDPVNIIVHIKQPNGVVYITEYLDAQPLITRTAAGIFKMTFLASYAGHYACNVRSGGAVAVSQNFEFYADRPSA